MLLSFTGGCLDQKMDIAILGDVSRSMNKDHRNKLTRLVYLLVEKLGVSASGNHYALGTFGSYAPIHSYLNSGRYYTAKNLKDLVRMRFKFVPKKVGTRTDLSMGGALKIFTRAKGDRPDAKNVLLVFTDGAPYIDKWDKRKWVPFGPTTRTLEVIQPLFVFTLMQVVCVPFGLYQFVVLQN